MTILNFSKTRIVYWTGVEDQLIYPDTFNALPAGVTKVFGDRNFNYNVYAINGNVHNWHTVPMNYYGLYCTDQEMLMMYQNNSEIKPLNMKCTIGHSIPLNTTTTGTITNLSFNNTIYSLIHDLPANDWITIKPWGKDATQSYLETFFNTFDGGRRDDGTQLLLPRQDILFKVPFTDDNDKQPITTQSLATGDITITAAQQAAITAPLLAGYQLNRNIYLTQNNLVNMYLPEILQCNTKTKALYPGENQDFMDLNIKDNGYATINTSSIRVNEFFSNKDDRNWGLNMNTPWEGLTYMNVCPLINGTQKPQVTMTNTNVYDIITPYLESDVGSTTQSVEAFQARFFRELIRHRHNVKEDTLYNSLLPHKLVKCLPIVDNTDTNIAHTVCATITWELTLEVKEEIMHIVNPYISSVAFKDRVMFNNADATTGAISKNIQEYYTRRWPYKPLAHDVQKVRNRNYYKNRPTTVTDNIALGRDKFVPEAVTTVTGDTIPIQEQVSDGAWLHGVNIVEPTNTFIGSITYTNKRVTRSMTKAALLDDAMQEI